MSDIPEESYKYALKCIYNAHSADVRVVKALHTCAGFLTGSRDSTAKLWVPNGRSYKESQIFMGGTTFISSLCILPESSQYPKGLILAGSNDYTIYGFSPDCPTPILKLFGHSGQVCSLTYGSSDFFVSGSWDKTARVWSGIECKFVLEGHKEAVWATAIFPSQNKILTGSADKTIRLWSPRGVCEKLFTGHTDCVRGLAIISDTKFVSCGNDNTVRTWLIYGDCIDVFRNHSDYIYSITLLDNGKDFATCGEDQTIKIWKDGICAQTVVLLSKSLWSIACLSNGDLAIGTSDGKVYVLEKVPEDFFETVSFTCRDYRANSPTSIISEEDITSGNFDIRSSIYDGEKLVFYESDFGMMYVCKYNYRNGTKVKKEDFNMRFIRDTFYRKAPKESTPQLLKDEKDHTFYIDVQGTKYKLSFNKGENPWEVAHKFVTSHNLLTEHVGQIVDFILKNTNDTSLVSDDCFPVKNYNTYLTVFVVGLKTKLLEFCWKVDRDNCLSPAEVNDLVQLAECPAMVSTDQLSSLDKVILWNDEFLFPVLDLLRICVKCESLHSKLSSKEFMSYILHIFMQTRMSLNRVLIAKLMCNMFGIHAMEDALKGYQERIFLSVKEVAGLNEESIQKACSSLFLNFAVASGRGFTLDVYSFSVNIMAILDLEYYSDHEAIYRLLLAIGTVCAHDSSAMIYFEALDLKGIVDKFENYHGNFKIESVARLLRSKFLNSQV